LTKTPSKTLKQHQQIMDEVEKSVLETLFLFREKKIITARDIELHATALFHSLLPGMRSHIIA
jgi:hypothetical protein